MKHIPAWLPGAGFQRIAQAWREQRKGIADRPYAFVKARMASGKYKPSYLSNIFETQGVPKPGSEEELIVKWSAASLYTGGADTVSSKTVYIFTFPSSDANGLRLFHLLHVSSLLWPYIQMSSAEHKMKLNEFWGLDGYRKWRTALVFPISMPSLKRCCAGTLLGLWEYLICQLRMIFGEITSFLRALSSCPIFGMSSNIYLLA